jgi:predicted lipoprotein with Yx(FWY)xxD motif
MLHKSRQILYLGALAVLLLLLVACGGQAAPTAAPAPANTPAETKAEPTAVAVEAAPAGEEAPMVSNAVVVADQALGEGGTVTIADVTSDTAGWLVVHAQADGKPGPILGEAQVAAGDNRDVVVKIDPAKATGTLYAMLHVDAGVEGQFEFPGGADVPATDAAGNVVTPPFNVTGGLAVAATVMVAESDELGPYLTDGAGMTLYRFNADPPDQSSCTGQCLENWPPLLTGEDQQPQGKDGVVGQLGTFERDDGTYQVTYQGMPLYYWHNDSAPGDTSGQGVGDVWFVVSPFTVAASGNDELGAFLVGANGMTLYHFTRDDENSSNCYDQCAENWPPLLVQANEAPVPADGVTGKLGVAGRDDGTFQVTYDGMPLYYWAKDEAPGDTTGQGVGDVWFVVPPSADTASSNTASSDTVAVGGNDALGAFLVDASGMTLYHFTRDDKNSSNCYDQCASSWPPLLIQAGETPAAGDGVTGELGVTERDDGTFQVTYDGMPLYYWAGDSAAGDTNGQGVGGVWFVVPPTSESVSSSDGAYKY